MEEHKKEELLSEMDNLDPVKLPDEELAYYAEQMSDWSQDELVNFAQNHPDWVEPMKNASKKYYGIVKDIVESNNKNTEHVQESISKVIESNKQGLDDKYNLAKATLDNYNKELNNKTLTIEDIQNINEDQRKLNETMSEEVAKTREANERLVQEAEKEDFKNKGFDLGMVFILGAFVVDLISTLYNGKGDKIIDLKKLPKK